MQIYLMMRLEAVLEDIFILFSAFSSRLVTVALSLNEPKSLRHTEAVTTLCTTWSQKEDMEC